MNRSTVIALVLAGGVAAWIGSGLMESGPSGPARAQSAPPSHPAPAREADLVPVRVRSLVAVDHARELALFGRTEAERSVDLRAETTGRVVARPVAKGAAVMAGEIIVRLAMDDRQVRLNEAEALVRQRAMVHEAGTELARQAYRSKIKVAESRADMEAARASLEAIRLDIERTEIRAPFAGVIDDLLVEEGDYVTVGGAVARLVDLDPVLVVAEVSERDIGALHPGQAAVARGLDGRETAGRVRYVSRTANASTRTFRVETELPNPQALLPRGMTMDLRLALDGERAHLVSPALLTLSRDGAVGVKAVDEAGIVVFHPAKVLADTSQGMWLGGLPERLAVITLGQEFVSEGQRVRPVPEEPRPGAGS